MGQFCGGSLDSRPARPAPRSTLTRGFVADYRVSRKREGCEGGTINRDLCALSAFFTWLGEGREIEVTKPHFRHEEESAGRERWLSADELRALLNVMPAAWKPFFALMAYTGLRLVGKPKRCVGQLSSVPIRHEV